MTSAALNVPSSPSHHVPEDVLAEYVTGRARQAAALAVACHLTLCAACRARARAMETLAGAWMTAGEPAPLAPESLERALARLDAPAAAERPDTPDTPDTPDFLTACRLPRPLLRAVAAEKEARWRFLVPGIQVVELPMLSAPRAPGAPGTTVRLVKLKPGLEIPLHDHAGTEYTLIFTGALTDAVGHFARGDLSYRLAGERHVQRVDAGEDCVALQVNEGALRPLTWKGRLLGLLARN
jgi:putative transcriptional regulator